MKLRITVALSLALASFAGANDIVPLRNHRTSSLAFLRPVPLGPVLTDRTETRWQLTVANEMRDLGLVYEDAETWRISYFYRAPLSDGTEWFFEVPYIHRGGGLLDPTLDWWHRIFVDDGNPLRDATPYGRSNIQVPGGTYSSADGLGDITVGAGKDLDWATARIWLKLPTGNPNSLLGSGAPDAALSLDRTWTLAPRFRLASHLGLTAQGKPSELQNARGLVDSAALAFSYQANTRDTWVLQWNSEASPTRFNLPEIDATHRLISLAYIRKSADSEFSVAFMQDGDFGWFDFPGGAQIGPDWTLSFGYTVFR